MKNIILVGLNEVNFDFVRLYAKNGHLPYLSALIESHGISRTKSEAEYRNIEPWIQWVSIQTGLAYKDHEVFRLGDIVHTNMKQLWETVEEMTGEPTVAICPMNARNEVKHRDSIFLPDPWTDTPATGPWLLRHLSKAVSKFVNSNAGGKLDLSDYWALAAGLLAYSRPRNWTRYAKMIFSARKASWRKALLLDMFLGDILCVFATKRKPSFASLFLNAAAHIQHHYMLASPHARGKNPEWYIGEGNDPLLESYKVYDQVVKDIALRYPETRLLIATGLHQDPNDNPFYYWRPKDHATLLIKLGLRYQRVLPRMSRDFLIDFESDIDAGIAADRLRDISVTGKSLLFDVDIRGKTLFVEVIYAVDFDLKDSLSNSSGKIVLHDAKSYFAFVAIKNGIHNQEGYLIDTDNSASDDSIIGVEEIFRKITSNYA